jgi:tetratricopeptide (TPR) repeat protein
MFTFSDAEYKWCISCNGNIRKESSWCKLCRNPITSKFFARESAFPMNTINDAARWLPRFNSLIVNCSNELQERLKRVDDETPPPTIGIPDGVDPLIYRVESRDEEVCGHEPPDPTVSGMLWDFLLAIHASGASLQEICAHPKLQLLEITPQEILAEYELRKSEIENGQRCRYCSEFILSQDLEPCRFCEGLGDKTPKQRPSFLSPPLNLELLRDVILYEAAVRTMSGAEQISPEILAANKIDASIIDREVLKQRSSAAPPMTRWLRRMRELGLKSYLHFDSMLISSFVDVGTALKKRDDEAIIVLEHAVARGENLPEAQYDVGRALEHLSLIYKKRQNYEKAKELQERAKKCMTYGMDEATKQMMESMTTGLGDLEDTLGVDEDPEARLISYEETLKNFTARSDALTAHMESVMPGLGAALSGFVQSLSAETNRVGNVGKLRLEAGVAEKQGDYKLAESKYLEVLDVVGEGISITSLKSGVLTDLAALYQKTGDLVQAEARFHEAIDYSRELFEAKPDFGGVPLATARAAYAKFLRDQKRFDEACKEFQIAINMQEAIAHEFSEKYGHDVETYSDGLAMTLVEYAELLTLMNRTEEAVEVKARAKSLNDFIEARRAEIAAQRKVEKEFGF